MTDIEHLKAVYEEKQSAYHKLCDAYVHAMDAANGIKAMCDAAMDDMHKAGQEFINAAKADQQ